MKKYFFIFVISIFSSSAFAKELQSCSKYSEVSCAGQQSYGWGCKPGAEACSPIKSGDCTCGSGSAMQGGGSGSRTRGR